MPTSIQGNRDRPPKDAPYYTWNAKYPGEKRKEKRAIWEKFRGGSRPSGPWKKIVAREDSKKQSPSPPTGGDAPDKP